MLGFAPTAYAPTAYIAAAQVTPPPGDTVEPVLTGQLAVSGITHNSATLTVPTASDNVGVVGYEYSLDGGATYALGGSLPTVTLTGLPSATTFQARMRAYDAAGLRSAALAKSFTTAAVPVEPPPTGAAEILKVSAQRIVIFEGSGARMEFSNMTAKLPYKVGDKWMSDRDPDEESRYAADITEELEHRMTTAVPGDVELVLVGVASLADPVLETVSINGVPRTFVISFLGPAGTVPVGWSWAARVRCANGELFDHTTYFNKKET